VLLEGTVERLAGAAALRHSTIDRAALIDRFPREFFLEEPDRRPDFAACRAIAPTIVFIQNIFEAKPDFVPERDGPSLSALSSTLVSVTSALFAKWAEPTYCIAAMIGYAVPTPDQSRVIIAAMDARNSLEFAFIVPRPEGVPGDVVTIELGAGVAIYRNYKALGGVVCLRASFQSLTGNFGVFGI
jgi:hypothetical protein